MITYLIGDATKPIIKEGQENLRLIVHICNNLGGWGRGFVNSISSQWKEPEKEYRKWFNENRLITGNNKLPLGSWRMVPVENGKIMVVNMIAQDEYVSSSNPVAIRYSALFMCFSGVKQWIDNFRESNPNTYISVHGPRLGAGLANGDWKTIEGIVDVCLTGEDVFIYDLK